MKSKCSLNPNSQPFTFKAPPKPPSSFVTFALKHKDMFRHTLVSYFPMEEIVKLALLSKSMHKVIEANHGIDKKAKEYDEYLRKILKA
jgi:hypothetical protein